MQDLEIRQPRHAWKWRSRIGVAKKFRVCDHVDAACSEHAWAQAFTVGQSLRNMCPQFS